MPTTTTDSATNATTPKPERAWALHCQGLHSPEISARLGVSERTVRSWITRIARDLAAEYREERETNLAVAIARKRQLAAVAWDAYERARAIEDTERAHALNAAADGKDGHHEHDDTAALASLRAARRALATAVRCLSLIATTDRDLVTLQAAFHTACDQHDADEYERHLADEREQERREREREHFLREEARRDRAKEREREPRPPFGLDSATLAPQRWQEPATRLPEVNAYFAAYDTYHAAREAADTYTALLARATEDRPHDRDDDDYLVRSAFSLRQPQRPPQRPPERQQSESILARLTPADIATLSARLDAEEAEEAAEADAHDRDRAEDRAENADDNKIAAKLANPPTMKAATDTTTTSKGKHTHDIAQDTATPNIKIAAKSATTADIGCIM